MLTHHHRKDLKIEGHYLPDTVHDLIDLRERIVNVIAGGHIEGVTSRGADAVANGITGWLVAKAAGQTDTLTGSTRSKYRRVLAALDDEAPAGPERGSTSLRSVGLLASGGLVAAAASPMGAVALEALRRYSTL